MSIYRWAMRNGAMILFVAALLIFVVSLAGQLAGAFGGFGGQSPGRAWFFLAAFGNAFSSSALMFFGACLLYRLDQRWGSRS
jgi:hypothetical protein